MDSAQTALVLAHKNYLVGCKPRLVELSANHSSPFVDMVIAAAVVEVSKNEALAVCTPESLYQALAKAVQYGLVAGGGLAHCYLIPRNNKKKGVVEVELQIGYEGLIQILISSGVVKAIVANVVYENDKFSKRFSSKDGDVVEHEPCLDPEKRGNPVGVYAAAFLANGLTQVEFLTMTDISKIKAASQGGGTSGPWAMWPDQMRRKSAIKRLSKYLHLDPQAQDVVQYDTSKELGLQDDQPPGEAVQLYPEGRQLANPEMSRTLVEILDQKQTKERNQS